ncbi:hypothetical protein A9K75_08910 [Campylobacter fetus subsp. testudinum]|uniref:hypothetical protein n=1 Tax=Campylobacter fetus TaxID=196 RepID=UPI000818BEA0|nr:hypothetical protein [Campylobacter fetus]OCR98990.1 hypothetical protein A9K75_08910 [Campylobacter fetus subsp. testudinum]
MEEISETEQAIYNGEIEIPHLWENDKLELEKILFKKYPAISYGYYLGWGLILKCPEDAYIAFYTGEVSYDGAERNFLFREWQKIPLKDRKQFTEEKMQEWLNHSGKYCAEFERISQLEWDRRDRKGATGECSDLYYFGEYRKIYGDFGEKNNAYKEFWEIADSLKEQLTMLTDPDILSLAWEELVFRKYTSVLWAKRLRETGDL